MRIGYVWWGLLLLALWASYSHAQGCQQATLQTEFFTDPTQRQYVACATDGDLAGPNVDDNCVLQRFNALCTNNANCKTDNVLSREVFLETIIDSAEAEKLARSTNANDQARRVQADWWLTATAYNLAKASWQQKWKNVYTPADSPITNAAINAAQLKDAPRSTIICHRPGTLADVSCGLRNEGCS